MRQYESYKDSGVEWIGKIPSHWTSRRFKFIVNSISKGNGITKEEVFPEGDTPCVRYGEIYTKYEGSFVKCISKTNKNLHSVQRYFNYGDLLFAGTGELIDEIGKNIVYLGKSPCLAGGDIIIASHDQNPIFLNYSLNSASSQNQKSCGKAKLKVVHISSFEIGNIIVPLPPLAEQQAIASYLDERTTQIDNIIKSREEKIKLLEELKASIISNAVTKGIRKDVETKDSGIEWIGRIPKHWEVRKLKYIAFLKSGDTIPPSQFTNSGYSVYGGNGFRGYTNKFNNEGKHVLIGRQGALCGNINYADGKFYASEHAVVVYPHKNENLTWLGELLRISNLNQYSTSAAQPGLAVSNIVNISYPYPPEEEREEIAKYIDKSINRIGNSINKAKQEICLLKEYRASLITEVVTGKRKVL